MRLLVGFTGRAGDGHLLSYAQLLARSGAVVVRILHIVERVTLLGGPAIETPEEAVAVVEEAVFSLRMVGIGASGAVREGRVNRLAAILVDEALSWQADTIVLSGRRTRRWQILSGRGVREQLLRHSPIPIAVVAAPATVPTSTNRRQNTASSSS